MTPVTGIRLFGGLLGMAALLAAPAQAAKRVVDSDGEATTSNCNALQDTPYHTIASALEDSNPGDTIVICPGLGPYDEQLHIVIGVTLQGKSGATLKPSSMTQNSTSLSSGNPIAAAILVDGTPGVSIQTLVVDGEDNGIGGCSPNPIGVYFRNASGSVTNSVVRNFRLGAGLGGCQSGLGIFVQTDGGPGTANVTVRDSSVHDFQKNGITANEEGAVLTATGNRVTGDGHSPVIAQNGIQIGFGAGGTVTGNYVSEVVYAPCAEVSDPDCSAGSSTGILVFEGAAGTSVTKNTIITTQTGIYLDTNSGTASSNIISHTLVYDGIYVPGDSNTVSTNTIFDSDEAGVFIDGNSNTLNKNKLNEAPVGIFVSCTATGNLLGTGSAKNTFFNVGEETNSCTSSLSSFTFGGGARANASAIR